MKKISNHSKPFVTLIKRIENLSRPIGKGSLLFSHWHLCNWYNSWEPVPTWRDSWWSFCSFWTDV